MSFKPLILGTATLTTIFLSICAGVVLNAQSIKKAVSTGASDSESVEQKMERGRAMVAAVNKDMNALTTVQVRENALISAKASLSRRGLSTLAPRASEAAYLLTDSKIESFKEKAREVCVELKTQNTVLNFEMITAAIDSKANDIAAQMSSPGEETAITSTLGAATLYIAMMWTCPSQFNT
jgi:hypothetical protein